MMFNQIYNKTTKQQIITNWCTICAFLYGAFMSYLEVYVQGNVYDLYLHYLEFQIWWERMVHDTFYERIPKYMSSP